MAERVVSVILLIVLLCLLFVLPKALKSGEESETPAPSAPASATDPYAGLEKLSEFPAETVFPKDYILVYDRTDGSKIVIIEKGMNYLVSDSAEDSYGGLFVNFREGKYYYRNLLSDGGWGTESAISGRDASYMENELTKDRWEYPKKFVSDYERDFKDSGKSVYIGKKEKIAGIECNHYIIKSAWYEHNYWVDPKTNITLKYSKVEVRFGERATVFEITAGRFSNKPDFKGYLPEDIIPR